jgi:dephospho-CoA kinase
VISSCVQSRNKPIITGITGGIGSGKSTVTEFLSRRFRLFRISADDYVHGLLEPGEAGWEAIHDVYPHYVKPDQSINKPLLRENIFNDGILRRNINDAIHPLVQKKILTEIDRESRKGISHFLVEVPLLYEAKWEYMFHDIIVVYASKGKCIERIMNRDNVTSSEAEMSFVTQLPMADKAELADHVIDNSGLWVDTIFQLIHLGNILWPEESLL